MGRKIKKRLSERELQLKYRRSFGIELKTREQIKGIGHACKIASIILEETCNQVREGVTTEQLDAFAYLLHEKLGAIPAPLHYGSPPFPKSICTSVNEVVCHGIPDNRTLCCGDILNIDVTAIVGGFYGDCSCMVALEPISEEASGVISTSRECLERSIAILKPGILLSQIGEVISNHAEKRNCSVVYQFVGHGTGLQFHEEPQVCHHRNERHIRLVEGMVFTIEPMINAGEPEIYVDAQDQWTARTMDGKLSAQHEHTLCITEGGCEKLTQLPSCKE